MERGWKYRAVAPQWIYNMIADRMRGVVRGAQSGESLDARPNLLRMSLGAPEKGRILAQAIGVAKQQR